VRTGAFVTWGVTQANVDALLGTVIRPIALRGEDSQLVEFEGYHSVESDEVDYEVLEGCAPWSLLVSMALTKAA
jgi:hypothetical protein